MPVFSIVILTACVNSSTKINPEIHSSKKIEVSFSPYNRKLFMILRCIAEEDPMFKYRKSNYQGKPMMFDARTYFESYKTTPCS